MHFVLWKNKSLVSRTPGIFEISCYSSFKGLTGTDKTTKYIQLMAVQVQSLLYRPTPYRIDNYRYSNGQWFRVNWLYG